MKQMTQIFLGGESPTLKGTTILLVWKVLLNQTDRMVIFSPNMKIMFFFHKIVLNELHVPEVSA